MMKSILASATLLAFAAPALAQVTSQPPATKPSTGSTTMPSAKGDMFTTHDVNKDGSLSLAEVQKADATVTQADFDKYDGDKTMSLSKAEFTKWAEAKHAAPASAPGQ